MKQYKHKRTGKVVQEIDPKTPYLLDKLSLSSGLKYRAMERGELYEAWIIEDSLDWELVVNKTYEILAGGDKAPITKIKRLSDGVIFEVGDWVSHLTVSGVKERISSIKAKELHAALNGGMIALRNAVLIKPTLISEDGVKLYEGDPVFFIPKDGNLYSANMTLKAASAKDRSIKVFSTEKAALNYLVDNYIGLGLSDFKDLSPIRVVDYDAIKQRICKKLGINYADL